MAQESINLKIPFSILDLATIAQGRTAADAFHHSLEVARLADNLGFKRYWLAEHHNSISVASSATVILIGYIAQGTTSIRVGSGGIMLPNHSPLIVAEQFGTLTSLYPDRIDLGLGRAPGTDQLTALAIRGENQRVHDFPNDVVKLQTYFSANNNTAKVRAIPGEGLDIPLWILGSSLDSALLASSLGLPYAFASHFSPYYLLPAIDLYRRSFKASAQLSKPYVMACVNVVAADTDAEADLLATSLHQLFLGVISGKMKALHPPQRNMATVWDEDEELAVLSRLTYSFIGGADKLKTGMNAFIKETGVDEIMITSHIYDQAARLKSHEIFARVMK
ncbi:MAG: LLM class flavin-dependent oxidoreductase [Chryseolinea sp.]